MAKKKVRNKKNNQMRPNNQEGPNNQEKQKISPQQEEVLDLFIINGMNIINEKNFSESFLNKVKVSEDPVKATAEVLVDLIIRLKKSAQGQNKQIDDSLLASGANVLLGELLKLLIAAGMKPFTKEQKIACFQFAVSLYFDKSVKNGDMSEQELIATAKEVSQTEQGKKVLQTAKKKEFNMPQGGM